MKGLLTLCMILFLGTLCAESSPTLRALWARGVSENGGGSEICSVAADPAGNVYAVGDVGGSYSTVIDGVTLTPSENSMALILKYDSKGKLLWARLTKEKGPGGTRYLSVAVDAKGNAYAVGYVGPGEHQYGDAVSLKGMLGQNPLIVKYDPQGRAVWARGLAEDSVSAWDYEEGGGPSSRYSGAAVDREGGIYAVGNIDGGKILFSSTAPQFRNAIDSSTKHGAVIVKYDSSGMALWASGFAGEGTYGEFRAVQADDRGGAYAVGYARTESAVSFGDGVLLPKPRGGTDYGVLVKYDSKGNTLWAKCPEETPESSDYMRLAIDEKGSVYVLGSFEGAGSCDLGNGVMIGGPLKKRNMLLAKYDAKGMPQWGRGLVGGSGTFNLYSNSLVASEGKILVSGEFDDAMDPTPDFGQGVKVPKQESIYFSDVLLVYDSSGNVLDLMLPGYVGFEDMKLAKKGVVVVGGKCFGEGVDFGNRVTIDKYKGNLRNGALFVGEFAIGDAIGSGGPSGATLGAKRALQKSATCIDSRVRVRSSPDLRGDTLGYLEKGDELELLERDLESMKIGTVNEYWYRIKRLSDGLTGWSFGQYLKLGD
jgi:hypothetical protein